MSHIDYARSMPLEAPTPDEWLQPASRMGSYLNKLAQRTDLSATVGPGVGLGNPACFLPWRAEIRVDTELCLPGAEPGDIDPADALWRLEHPVFMGATGHEAAHAAHTRWTVAEFEAVGTTPKMIDVIQLLEEPRCEARLLGRASGQRLFLRSTALELILRDFSVPQTPYGAAGICALVMARIDGGTLDKKDGAEVREAVLGVLGSKYDELRPLWQEFLYIGDRNLPSMHSVARRWLEVLGEDPDGTEGLVFPGAQPQQEGDGSWMRSAVGGAAIRAEGAIIERRAAERGRRGAAAAEADASRRERAERAASDAFQPLADGSPQSTAGLMGERPPTEDEQRAATELAQRLLSAEQQDTTEVGRASRIRPPGRLRSREASQAAAYKELGVRARPEMFRARDRVPDARGPLSVALMLDISGSMQAAETAISSTHWVVSHAGHRVGARTVAVHFGSQVHGVARPGQLHDNVRLYRCSDPWEQFRDGFLAADHELQLLDGPGARLLVIASDAQFRRDEQQKFAEAAMTLCRQKGVGVIWLQLTRRFVTNYGFGTVLDMQGRQPVEIAVAVGNAAVALMERSK